MRWVDPKRSRPSGSTSFNVLKNTNGRVILIKRSNLQSGINAQNSDNKVTNMGKEIKVYYIGIDVSKAKLDLYFNGKSYVIENNREAIASFIKEAIAGKKIALCVLESTGGYERAAVKAFQERGIAIHQAHPNKVHSFAKASNHFAKTDKLDAMLLYKYAQFIAESHNIGGDEIISENIEKLKSLKKLSLDLETRLHGVQCQLKQVPEACHRYLRKEISFLKDMLTALHKELLRIAKADEELSAKMTIMQSLQGIGEKVSITLLAELPELGSLSREEVASLCGVAPRTYQSGIKNVAGRIYGGRFNIRKNLYMAALVASRYSSWLAPKYKMLIANGKAKKVALVALMRKIIIALNYMIKNMQPYQILS